MSEYIIRTTNMPEHILEAVSAWYEIDCEIVRCRDCKYRYGCLHLVDDGDGDMRRCHATPDGYCAWGERREL